MIAAPPVDAGAVHVTEILPPWPAAEDADAITEAGALGAVAGIAASDATDGELVPPELVAVTVNVYEVPFVRPTTAQEVIGAVERQTNEPGLDVTV